MRNKFYQLFIAALITIGLIAVSSVFAQRPYRVSDRQVQNLLNRIEKRTDVYKRQMNRALDRSRLNGSDTEELILGYITDFENSTDRLRQNFAANRSVSSDVSEVLNRAAFIHQFMERNRLTTAAETQWRYLRADLDTLASYYSVSWSWNRPTPNVPSTRPYRVTDNAVAQLLTQIESDTDVFRRNVNTAIDRSRWNNTEREDNINSYLTEFENATDRLKQRFDARESTAANVEDVLSRAYYVDQFVRTNRLNYAVTNQWNRLKGRLNTLSGYYNVAWNWNTSPVNSGTLPYTVAFGTLQGLLNQIETRTDIYRRDMNIALNRSFLNNTRSEQMLLSYITDFENSTDRLKQNFDARRSTVSDVQEVLSRANYIDGFMQDYRFGANAENQWNVLRRDLNTLAGYYSVSWNWNNTEFPGNNFDPRLTGTYRLNTSLSDDVSAIVGRVVDNYYPANLRERVRRNLERRLTPPEMLAIEKRAQTVTMDSTMSPQVTFAADGTTRTETFGNRIVKVTANSSYNGVSLNYEGDRINDFYVNFMPMSNGQLRVVRRIYLENRNETITVASVYDKINNTAQWSAVRDNNPRTGRDFVVPNGTRIVARLNTTISTQASQDGDRFTMEVTSPYQYRGAIIEGRVVEAERSGRLSGRANISLEFDTIRLRNGQTYTFAGIIDNVRAANGDDIKVNNEGTVRDSNQTTKTVTRAGIGAALGALIGAIAGGGEGAAIGAAIGAGAGAGTIFIEGRDNIELGPNSEFTITATAPNNIGSIR